MNSEELSRLVVQGMREKKAMDIILMDLKQVNNAIADYFIICTGNSDTQLDAICQSVEETVFKSGNINPWHLEGKENKEWILLDYVDVVVHVFQKERRAFYAIEELWADAHATHIEDRTT